MTRTAGRALLVLIVLSVGLRLIWASVLSVGHDEAYHYLFAVHPDWSYFDHPPMTMLIEKLGLTLCGNDSALSLRLGFILLFAGSTWVMFRWTARWYGDWAGFYAALALNLTAYYTSAAGAFALPDGPLLFFALLTLWRLSEALVEPANRDRVLPWVWVGLAWAGALLSKYHAVFLPAGAVLYILLTPAARRCLLRPGPYLAAGLGLCGFLPVILWNLQNDWASFAFQAGRAVGWEFRLDSLLSALGGQMLYLFPWMWLVLVLILVRFLRAGNALVGIERLLACESVVPLAFFLGLSCMQSMLPHWALIGFVPLFPALGADWAAKISTAPRKWRWALAAQAFAVLLAAGLFALQACLGVLPLKHDPSLALRDWSPVVKELESRGLVGRPGTFLFTRSWFESGHLAFALHNRAPVLCYSRDARGFAYWSRPEDWLGQDGIFLTHGDNSWEPTDLAGYFRKIERITQFPTTRHGNPVGNDSIQVYHCIEQIKPFPFRPHPSGPTH